MIHGLGKGTTLVQAATFLAPEELVDIANQAAQRKHHGEIRFAPEAALLIARKVHRKKKRIFADYIAAWSADPSCAGWAEQVRREAASDLVDYLQRRAVGSR
ncbi:MAG: hypothetical protein ACOZE5_09135 [Verrucomicrobiota bacterium]